ncbi:DUF3592 domain-containing protein [Streptomyces jumonjinensis]|uniref:DUF3592 domain-containing protein n=1 Tax=Streptomyces jumonjinensis TaxID=1945 RepID=A0A646KA65_STRJU|nr:DUF3592 domain-containing protein [Streptomyces jumonjinensis]MQS99094.1 DUF3592 domain-containing protein [Streptomyces jumonjinensis]
MQIVFAAFAMLGGLVAVLAGAYGLRETRRIASAGLYAIALVKPALLGTGRPLLEYETGDGRVLEITSPVSLPEGSSVRLSYDPDDPREVVVDGHERAGVDRGFVLTGLLLAVIGLLLAVAGL